MSAAFYGSGFFIIIPFACLPRAGENSSILGCRQAVRHSTCAFACVGSSKRVENRDRFSKPRSLEQRTFFGNTRGVRKKEWRRVPCHRGRIPKQKVNNGVSSSGKTQHFDCCMRRFESCHPSQKSGFSNPDFILPKKLQKPLFMRLPGLLYLNLRSFRIHFISFPLHARCTHLSFFAYYCPHNNRTII